MKSTELIKKNGDVVRISKLPEGGYEVHDIETGARLRSGNLRVAYKVAQELQLGLEPKIELQEDTQIVLN